MARKVIISFCCDPGVASAMRKLAEKRHARLSHILREAIASYVGQNIGELTAGEAVTEEANRPAAAEQ
ncbi:MAG: hypothetical protein QXS54_03115 [Candidatus Methanomethylicaceae archaeon]